MEGFLFLFVCFMTLLTSSNEGPVDFSPPPQNPGTGGEHTHDSRFISLENSREGYNETLVEDNGKYFMNRSNYSRMLPLTTTIGYDEWWFYTTRISPISLKDFPGRPGVASWKEISRSSPTEKRRSRNMNGPQAAGVSSGSWSFASNCNYSQMTSTGIWMLLFLICFCWI